MSVSNLKSFAQSFRDNNNYNQTSSSFRVSSDFFYKTGKEENHREKQTMSMTMTMTPPLSPNSNATKAKIKVEKSLKGIKKVVDKYSDLKMSMQSLSNISQVLKIFLT
jgi:hypothetical protein